MRHFDFPSGKLPLFLCGVFSIVIFSACKKDLNNLKPAGNNALSVDTSGYVVGAHGELIPQKNFHIIEKGYKLAIQNQHVYKVEIASGKLVEDFGVYGPVTTRLQYNMSSTSMMTPSGTVDAANLSRAESSKGSNSLFGTSSGWVAAEEWQNPYPFPIDSFGVTCVVPPMPTTQDNQTFAFWIGISPSTGGGGSIVQPILNYGQPPRSTAQNTYQVFNYFLWGNSAAMTTPETVTSGTTIRFGINYNGTTNGSYDYISNILNAAGAPITPTMLITVGNDQNLNANGSGNITIGSVSESNYADIVLEDRALSPYMTEESEYPNAPSYAPYVAMTDITMAYGSISSFTYPGSLSWYQIGTGNDAQLGESPQIISTNNNNPTTPGQVDLWFGKCAPPSNTVGGEYWYNPTETLSWAPVPGAVQYEMVINSGPHGGGAFYYTSSTSIPNFFQTIEQDNTPGTYQVILTPIYTCGNGPSTYYTFSVCATNLTAVGSPSWTNSTETLSWGAVTGATQYEMVINSGPHGGGAFYYTTATSITNFFQTIEQDNTPGNYQVIITPLYSCGAGPSTYYSFTYSN